MIDIQLNSFVFVSGSITWVSYCIFSAELKYNKKVPKNTTFFYIIPHRM